MRTYADLAAAWHCCLSANGTPMALAMVARFQEELVRSYGLASEMVGVGTSARLRILPPGGSADASVRVGREWSGAPWRGAQSRIAAR